MLMQNILESYRNMATGLVSVSPDSTVAGHWPAANAGQFTGSADHARRLRRQRRAERHTRGRLSGWVVRTW